MSLGHILVLVHINCSMSLRHTGNQHSVSKLLVYHGVKMDTDDIFMSLVHILVPVHTICAISLGLNDTFTFCIKTTCISWHQD